MIVKKVKKALIMMLVAMFVVAAAPLTNVYASDDIRVIINGVQVTFAYQEPVIINEIVLIPVREVAEHMGFSVYWDSDTHQVFLSRADDLAIIQIGSDVLIANGVNYTMCIPAQIIGGRTMIPITAIQDATCYELYWDSDIVTIAAQAQDIASNVELPAVHLVVPGDYLRSIALLYYGSGDIFYRELIINANPALEHRINMLFVGDVLTIPALPDGY